MTRLPAYLSLCLTIAGCGGASAPFTAPTTVAAASQVRVLLDVMVAVPAANGCNTGSNAQEFMAEAGTSMTVEATGAAAMAPSVVVYGPDWATQLIGTTTSGPGSQTLSTTAVETGPHRVSVCATNSVGGPM